MRAALELAEGLAAQRLDQARAQLRTPVDVTELKVLTVTPRVRGAALAKRRRVPPAARYLLPAAAAAAAAAPARCGRLQLKREEEVDEPTVTELAVAAVPPRVQPAARSEADRVTPATRGRDGVLAHERLDAPRAHRALLVAVAEHAVLANAKREELPVGRE